MGRKDWAASFHVAPPIPPPESPLRGLLPHRVRVGLCDQQNMEEVRVCHLQGGAPKDIVASAHPSGIPASGQAGCHEEPTCLQRN